MLTDEVRRSGRATKGQHTKNLEVADEPTPTKRGGKANKAKASAEPTPPADDDVDAIIRCICGYVEEDEDDDRVMIVCDNCEAWQHNECMEISENPDDLPDQYFCEQCKPEDHKELLSKVARGEKPWEERAKQREREEEERKAHRRKGGKKGKRGRGSEVKPEVKPEVEPEAKPDTKAAAKSNGTPSAKTPTQLVAQVTAGPVGDSSDEVQTGAKTENGQKRKFPDESINETYVSDQQVCIHSTCTHHVSLANLITQEQPNKIRKISSPVEAKTSLTPQERRKSSAAATPAKASSKRDSKGLVLQTELVENISDLQNDARRRVATALVRLFVDQTQQAQKDGTFKLPQGQSIDGFGLQLGLQVEYAVYLNFWGHSAQQSPQYSEKFRMINHNVKANPALRDRLLSGALSPNEMSKMSSFDMASKELQQKTEEIMKESEKQHIIIQEDGPRIRRTHKGEELVDNDAHMAQTSDTVFAPTPVRRRESEIDPNTPKQASPPATSPPSPAAVEEATYSATAGSPTTNQPLVVDTSVPPRPGTGADRKSASNFNIQDVWSSVSGPAGLEGQRVPPIPQQASLNSVPAHVPQGSGESDADIDRLLKDEEADEEEPYSPTDYAADPGSTIWRGKVTMPSIAEFHGVAKHVAGANLSSTYPWPRLIPSSLMIEGRIAIDRASDYLCGLKWSHTTEISVVSVTPTEDPDSKAQFDKLFSYFTDRDRWGVIGKSSVTAVKDTYLVPLEVGMSKKPDFVELLEYCTIGDPSPERMLLLTFVVKNNNSPTAQNNSANSPPAHATPRHLDAAAVASPIAPSIGHSASNSFSGPTPIDHSYPHNSPAPGYPHMPHQYNNTPTQPQHPNFQMPPHQTHQPPQPYPNPSGMDAARQALGPDLAASMSVAELLKEAPNTGIPEFLVIKEVLESVPASRADFAMLKGLLTVKHQGGGQ